LDEAEWAAMRSYDPMQEIWHELEWSMEECRSRPCGILVRGIQGGLRIPKDGFRTTREGSAITMQAALVAARWAQTPDH
jgi:hypothetical protein